jgi:nitrite reductase (NADH) small subunit
MNVPQWIRVTRCESVPLREGRALTLAGREIAIFNLGDRFVATDNRCPHQGGPLCDGIVSGDTVVCPLHAWKVRLDSGVVERPASQAACVTTYPTRVSDGVVWLGLPSTAAITPQKEVAEQCETLPEAKRCVDSAKQEPAP